MDERTIEFLSDEIDLLRKKVLEAEGILKTCLPYVEFHFDRARDRLPSKRLIEAIKKFIGET